MFNQREIKKLLTHMISMEDVFKRNGSRISTSGAHFCIFHENTETPSAKYYQDSNLIWCFAEQKMYTVYDALKVFGENPEKVFNDIWKTKTEEEKLALMESIGHEVEKPLPYLSELYKFKSGKITIGELQESIYSSVPNTDLLKTLYDLSRPIPEATKYSPYMYLAKCYNLDNYRIITDGEFITKFDVAKYPRHVTSFISQHHNVMIIFNLIGDKPVSCTLRAIESKAFVDWNMTTGMLYNIGKLRPDFKYGDPLVIVEGNKDCDVCKTFLYGDTVGILTAAISKNQMQVLEHLTDRLVLALDNDESGKRSTDNFLKYRGRKFNTSVFRYNLRYKDFGDLVDLLLRNNIDEFNNLITQYKTQLQIELSS